MTGQLTEPRVGEPAGAATTGRWVGPVLVAGGLAVAVFLLYYLAYPARHLSLPMGFDPPYYVWRGELLASQGIGTGAAAARPGYPIMSALIGSLSGLSQLQLMPVLSLVLVSLLALSVGGFVAAGFDPLLWEWALVVAVTGVVLGPTHLVGENLSNTLNLVFVVAALVPLANAVGGGPGMGAAVVMLVAAGVAHWDFLATFGLVLAVAAAMAWPESRRRWAAGVPVVRTEAGVIAVVAATAAAIVAAMVGLVLRAPWVTIEVGQDRVLYWKKFVRDLPRLIVPSFAALAGGWRWRSTRGGDRAAFSGRIVAAWTGVMTAGVVVGAVTLRLPPARFLALLVALPGAVVTARLLGVAVRWTRRRLGSAHRDIARWAPAAVALVAVSALAAPGVLRWYRYPVLLREATLREADEAGRYVRTLPAGTTVVFPVEYSLPPFPTGPILAERSIRIGLPPDRQSDAHVFVGDLADLMAGRLTPAPNARLELATRTYARDVAPLIRGGAPVVVVLRSVAGIGFEEAGRIGAAPVGPGVLVLRAPGTVSRVTASSVPRAVTGLEGLLWGMVALALLGLCGAGWTAAFVDPRSSPQTFASLVAPVGAAAVVIGGLVAGELGVRLGGPGGVATYAVLVVAGAAVGAAKRRTSRVAPS